MAERKSYAIIQDNQYWYDEIYDNNHLIFGY